MATTEAAFEQTPGKRGLLEARDEKHFQELFADKAIRSYVFLSFGMGLLALFLPIALVAVGGYDDHFSISYFYHVGDATQNILVGTLWATGVFLFLFQGLSRWENWILNVAGAAGISVAMNPMDDTQCVGNSGLNWHGASAILFFLCLATVAIGFSKTRIKHIGDRVVRRRFKRAYDAAGFLMIAPPAFVFVWHFLLKHRCETHYIYWIETAAIAGFAMYWFVKTLEYRLLLRIR